MNITHLAWKKWLFPLLLLAASSAMAQKETEPIDKYRVTYEYKAPTVESGGGSVTPVHVPSALPPDSLGVRCDQPSALTHYLDMHRRTNESTLEGKGFRIQIYAGSKMEVANEAKADFVQSFRDSGMEVYKDWNPPHFWVRVGDFLSRNEAMRYLPNVKAVFPDAFVVADKINMPKYKKQSSTSHNETQDHAPEGQRD